MSNIVEDDTKVNDPVDDVEEYSAPIIKTLNNRYIYMRYILIVACFSETYVFTMSFPFSFAYEQIDITWLDSYFFIENVLVKLALG